MDHGDMLAANRICNILANIAPFLVQDEHTLSSWLHAHEAMLRSTWEEKTNEHSSPRDHGCRFRTSPNSNYSGRRAGPFFILPTLVSHSFHLSWRWEEVGVFVGQNKVSSLYFSIFHAERAWSLTSFMPSFPNQLQTCNNQLWQLGKKGREL